MTNKLSRKHPGIQPWAGTPKVSLGGDGDLENPVALVGEQIVGLLDLVELEAMRDERAKVNPPEPSARAKPTVADGLAPHLLAGHFHDERFEISAREIVADILQAACQVLSYTILSALTTLRIEIERAQHSRRASLGQPFRN